MSFYTTIFLLQYFFILISTCTITINETTDNISTRILKQFNNYGIIFHYDNETASELISLFTGFNETVYLVNYDKHNANLIRPNDFRYVNMVYLSNPMEFVRFSDVDYNLEPTDIIIIFLNTFMDNLKQLRRYLKRLLKIGGLHRAGALFFYDLSTKSLLNSCFYCGNQTESLNLITNNENLPDLTKYVNDFHNFRGHLFHIGYTNFPPFFTCHK